MRDMALEVMPVRFCRRSRCRTSWRRKDEERIELVLGKEGGQTPWRSLRRSATPCVHPRGGATSSDSGNLSCDLPFLRPGVRTDAGRSVPDYPAPSRRSGYEKFDILGVRAYALLLTVPVSLTLTSMGFLSPIWQLITRLLY